MKAYILEKTGSLRENRRPLKLADMDLPAIGGEEVLIKISACGVCHTELDEIEGRTPPPSFPMILGHQVVGKVARRGAQANKFKINDRVGIGWIYSACGKCPRCLTGDENLCADFQATGRDTHGGYAEYIKINQNFAFSIPEIFSDAQAAPLLCAGAIGYRSLRLAKLSDGQNLGLTGFGASAHLVLKLSQFLYPQSKIFVFARAERERNFSLELGAAWAGDTADEPPEKLQAIIDTTPAWKPVVEALKNLVPVGRLVINAIRKEEADKDYLLKLDYAKHLWEEKEIKSIANVARRDIDEFLKFAAKIPIIPEVEEYPLEDANRALTELKDGKIKGAKVLRID
ncbi:MAG TPA: alcohol dehydrogenase [Deltaproteobacteria bacterium]|nr:alcohol dehydrogenase [Deltaproteobacteria bacterium]